MTAWEEEPAGQVSCMQQLSHQAVAGLHNLWQCIIFLKLLEALRNSLCLLTAQLHV